MAKYLKKYKTREDFENGKTALIHDLPELEIVVGLVDDIEDVEVIKDDDRIIHAVYEFPENVPSGYNPFFSGDHSDIETIVIDGIERDLGTLSELSWNKGIHKASFVLKENINDPNHNQYSYSFGFVNCIYLVEVSLGTLIHHLSPTTGFSGCSNLRSIKFSPMLTKLNGGEATAYIFKGCEKLKDFINWPKSLVSGLTWFSLRDTLWYELMPEDEILYFNNLLYGNKTHPQKNYELIVPEGIVGICGYAFWDDFHISRVDLPDGLESIGEYAFDECTKLKAINIPKTVHEIGQSAFGGCGSLSGIVDLSKNLGLKTLEADTFIMSGIQGIYLPKGLISIRARCFDWCTSLHTIICRSHKAPSVSSSTFNDSDKLYYRYTGRNTYNTGENKLYVPKGSTGYDTGVWKDILLNPNRCGFTLVELEEEELDNLINQ